MKNTVFYLFLVLLFAACNNNPQKENKANKDTLNLPSDTLLVSTKNSQKLDSTDISFFQEAAYGGMVEVESSKNILTFTENKEIETFANMIVKDHSTANERLKALALSKGYALPVILPNRKTALINKMSELKDEGKNEYYLRLMVNEHVTAIDLFSLASRSKDKEINEFASSLIPTLKHHYQQVLKLDSIYRLPRVNQGDDPLKLSDRTKQNKKL